MRISTVAVTLLGVTLLSACARTPRVDGGAFESDLAAAFQVEPEAVAVSGHSIGGDPPVALVEFSVESLPLDLEARFVPQAGRWTLRDLREIDKKGVPGRWVEPSVVIGRYRAEGAETAMATMATMAALAVLVERHAVDHDGKYPPGEIATLARLVVEAEYVRDFTLGQDAWGNPLAYHGAPDGQAYLIVSAGADGEWDRDLAEYFRATDAGREIYDGETSDLDADLVYATGAFVQSFAARD